LLSTKEETVSRTLSIRGVLTLALLSALLLGLHGPANADDGADGGADGGAAKAPEFSLKDVTGKAHKLSDYAGKWIVLEWTNYQCPFVKKHYHASHKNMQTLQSTYTAKGVVWLSICSSGEGKQGHMTPEDGTAKAAALGASPTALLLDADGTVGRLFGAKTTPDMRVINPEGEIVYTGAIDDTRSKNPDDIATSKNYIVAVLDAVLAGEGCPIGETRPYG
jgi:peroxiredoxin